MSMVPLPPELLPWIGDSWPKTIDPSHAEGEASNKDRGRMGH
jgi:hypothetical protein